MPGPDTFYQSSRNRHPLEWAALILCVAMICACLVGVVMLILIPLDLYFGAPK